MKNGQKPAEPRMEDVLASIRRAIDENAQGPVPAEHRVKFDPPANQATRPRRNYDFPAASTSSSQPQGFAGILGTRRELAETSPRDRYRPSEPAPRQPEPAVASNNDASQEFYEGYYGAQVEDYAEPEVESEPEAYQPTSITPPPSLTPPPRYLPSPAAPAAPLRQSFSPSEGLMSEASSEATHAAFNRLADTLTRRALGERQIADVAQDMLKSMLKQWLDENLPKLVERLVREEIERVVRRPTR
jgi:cell pole-organizing protein PopZ